MCKPDTFEGRILVIGYGNPSRKDDGLGPLLVDRLRALKPEWTFEVDFQLSIEHAEIAARHDIVIFADAAATGPDPFEFRKLEPKEGVSFTTHSVSPEGILHLARKCFQTEPIGYLLAMRGHDFEAFEEGLTEKAAENLEAAVSFLA